MLNDALAALFATNMGARVGERILVIGDTIRPDETIDRNDRERRTRLLEAAEAAARFAVKAYGSGEFIAYPATTAPGAEPPEVLWRSAFGSRIIDQLAGEGLLAKLLRKISSPAEVDRAREIVVSCRADVADVVVALANNSTSHTRFRSLVTAAGGRYASLPQFDPDMFFTSMRVDWQVLAARTTLLAERVNEAAEIIVATPNGTRMRIGKEGRTAKGDDGILTAPGSFGNLPAGEVYLAPREGTSEGIMVLEYAPTRKLASPLELVVKNGQVTAISGDDPHRQELEKKFAESDNNRNIAELGIGTNDRATRPDNILEAEKILGTIHIALGDNSGFGGIVQTPFHEDYVFYRPTLTAIAANGRETVLLRDGVLTL